MEFAATWIVVADGSQAKIFEERRRHGELRELPAWTARRADAGQSGRHDWFDQAFDEARFLKLLGRKLRRAAKDGAFRYLVLMAPPKALGALREGLSDAADRVEVSDPHEHTHASKVQIEAHLRALRQPT